MKTHFYILLMLGMVFLLGCEDEKLGTDLGVTNVVLPDISEESLGTEITIQGNGFIDCDVLALSPLSGGTEQPIYMETREVQSDHITVLYPSTATKDSSLVLPSMLRDTNVVFGCSEVASSSLVRPVFCAVSSDSLDSTSAGISLISLLLQISFRMLLKYSSPSREVIFLSLIFSVPSVKVTYLALEDIFSPLNISWKRADKALRRIFATSFISTIKVL